MTQKKPAKIVMTTGNMAIAEAYAAGDRSTASLGERFDYPSKRISDKLLHIARALGGQCHADIPEMLKKHRDRIVIDNRFVTNGGGDRSERAKEKNARRRERRAAEREELFKSFGNRMESNELKPWLPEKWPDYSSQNLRMRQPENR